MARKPTLDDVPDLMDLRTAAAATHFTEATLRVAIRSGQLEATIPRGRDPLRAGRGQGYRITKAALEAWYFNKPEVP